MKLSKYLFFVIIVSLIPFLTLYTTPDAPHTSDGEVQMPRMVAYYTALTDGHFPVRWAGDLNYGYGMPLFIFIYHTPFLISSLLLAAGVDVVLAFKLVLTASFILSGIGMYMFSREFFGDEKTALITTLLYQFAPYHLTEILVRGSVGGIYAYAFLPFALLGLTRLRKRFSYASVLMTAASVALMILSHNALALLFFGICVLFALLLRTTGKSLAAQLVSLGFGLELSAFYWIPALLERKFTYGDLFMKDLYRIHFPPVLGYIVPGMFDSQAMVDSFISPHIGYVQTAAIVAALYYFITKKTEKRFRGLAIVSFVLLVASFFVMHPMSLPLWERISLLRQFQFPWRIMGVVVFATSMLGVFVVRGILRHNPIALWLTAAAIVVPTFHYWQPIQGWDTVDRQAVWEYPLNTTYFGETDVIWSAGPATGYPPSRIEVISGEADISGLVKKTTRQTFTVDAKTDSRLISHTQYFPGWRVYVDGTKTPIEFQDVNHRGEITFTVPAGTHDVVVMFGESVVRMAGNIISALAILTLVAAFILRKKITTAWNI